MARAIKKSHTTETTAAERTSKPNTDGQKITWLNRQV
jgi:hypothetical protein